MNSKARTKVTTNKRKQQRTTSSQLIDSLVEQEYGECTIKKAKSGNSEDSQQKELNLSNDRDFSERRSLLDLYRIKVDRVGWFL